MKVHKNVECLYVLVLNYSVVKSVEKIFQHLNHPSILEIDNTVIAIFG